MTERPCTRCVKKGIGEQCVEGVRKKAKYLLEGDERLQMSSSHHPHQSSGVQVKMEQSPLMHNLPPPILPDDSIGQSSTGRLSEDVWLADSIGPTEPELLQRRQVWSNDAPTVAPDPQVPPPTLYCECVSSAFAFSYPSWSDHRGR